MNDRIEYIKSITGIYISEEDLKNINKESLPLFIYYFLYYAPKTFFPNGKIQCINGCNRSLTDLYCICKTYFPDKSLKEIFLTLKQIVFNELDEIPKEKIKTVYCAATLSFVFYHTRFHDYDWANLNRIGNNYKEQEYIIRPIKIKHSILDFVRITKCYKQMGWTDKDLKEIIKIRKTLKPF